MMHRKKIAGFTLLEVLIALLIFSLGLIGLAGLLTVSVRTNHSAYLRTQATFLAQGMADRMRANVLGLWGGNYSLNSISIPPATPTAAANTASVQDCSSASCSFANVALRDQQIWQNQLIAFLPNPGAAITCTVGGGIAPSASQLLALPPYTGTCEIQISWSNSAIPNQTSPQPEIFDWVFQP
ncbi:MAG: type IV pilus modification protein PilV [Gemmatimonadaceae bacterium]